MLHALQFKPCEMVRDRDLDFAEEMSTVKPHMCVPVESMHPLYLLYTSGTTGLPKVGEVLAPFSYIMHLPTLW